MDDNEVRGGNAAGRDAAGISLPTVAWQQADGEPAEETGGAPVTGAVAPEPKAETGPEAEPEAVAPAGAVPALPSDPETGTGTGTDTDADGDVRADAPADADAEEDPQVEVPVAVPAARAEGRPARRLSKPMIAAAATSGVVLMGVPLLLSQLGGGGGGGGQGPVPPRPSGYNQADGGPGGFVPRADAPEKGSSVPGAALPGATGAPGGRTTVAGKGPLATGVAGVGVGMGMPAAPVPTESGAPAAGKGGGGGGGAKPTGASGGGAPTTVPAVPRETAGTPQKPASQAPPAPPAPPAKRQYSAVAGPNCASTGAGFTYSGWYTDGKEGWQKYGSGGYSGGGCNGSFLSLPMSGKAGSDAGNALRWTFRTGSFTTGTCQVSVHIPSNGDIKAVGGKPAYYTVHAGATGSDPILRSFNVDQPSLRGQWVSAGSVRITGGVLTVKLHDRGLDWSGSQKTYAHHAGDAARVQCTSA
ncbi:hypothetical protein [Streptomyces termitum]|uniref:hypothetical protein n=1 Tax=Streptomyces termitum TaxID=67368 RepID=UPI00167605FD|nr:hypothetical protein [Streptomyces termitum]